MRRVDRRKKVDKEERQIGIARTKEVKDRVSGYRK